METAGERPSLNIHDNTRLDRRGEDVLTMSTEESLTLDKRLALVGFSKDAEPFIVVDTDKCNHCASKPCLYICPDELYAWNDKLKYTTEACMETRACCIVCLKTV